MGCRWKICSILKAVLSWRAGETMIQQLLRGPNERQPLREPPSLFTCQKHVRDSTLMYYCQAGYSISASNVPTILHTMYFPGLLW